MLYLTLKSLSSRLANFIDCLKELQELEAMCIIIPAFESLETKIQKYQKLNAKIICNAKQFYILEYLLCCEIHHAIENETIYLIMLEKQKAHHLATLESIKHFDKVIRKSLIRYRPKKIVSTLFD